MADSMINFGSGRGRLGVATRKWGRSVRERDDLPGSVLIVVELARDAADLADRARQAGDGRLYLSAASRLQVLVDRVERSGSRDRDAGAGGGDIDGELAELLGAGPAVGDAADS